MKLIAVIIIFFKLFSSTLTSPKIIGGRDAEENEFPYIVSLRRAEMEMMLGQSYHVCGGSIINKDTVVTASHCLFDPFGNLLHEAGSYFVVAGSRRVWVNEASTKYFIAGEIFKHPRYNAETLENDIAIIKFTQNFNFDLPSIQPIAISTSDNLTEGTLCSVHGWGILSVVTLELRDILQTVDLKISNHQQCNKAYNNTITSKQICAYEDDRDSCSGDSGGPFVCNNKLVGIVSFGYSCAVPGYPGVYTKVAAFQDFIENYRVYSNSPKSLEGKVFILVSMMTVIYKMF